MEVDILSRFSTLIGIRMSRILTKPSNKENNGSNAGPCGTVVMHFVWDLLLLDILINYLGFVLGVHGSMRIIINLPLWWQYTPSVAYMLIWRIMHEFGSCNHRMQSFFGTVGAFAPFSRPCYPKGISRIILSVPYQYFGISVKSPTHMKMRFAEGPISDGLQWL